jgi:hypothetical protein
MMRMQKPQRIQRIIMNNFLITLMSEPFLQYALLGGLLASIGCGIIGSFVVVRKIEYIAAEEEDGLCYLYQGL